MSSPLLHNVIAQSYASRWGLDARWITDVSHSRRLPSSQEAKCIKRVTAGSDKKALSAAQVRGLALFLSPTKGNCAACHTIRPSYALFTDGKFHNIGEGAGDAGDSASDNSTTGDGAGEFKDVGRFHQTHKASDTGAFKTPTLRNVALTAPYMHDGKLKTLQAVVDFYAGGGNSNPYLDPQIRVIRLSGQERSDLVEFLKSLTGTMPPNVGPPAKDAVPAREE